MPPMSIGARQTLGFGRRRLELTAASTSCWTTSAMSLSRSSSFPPSLFWSSTMGCRVAGPATAVKHSRLKATAGNMSSPITATRFLHSAPTPPASVVKAPSGSRASTSFREELSTFWTNWTSAPSPPPPAYSQAWFWDKAVIFTVFGITGSAAVWLVRPLVNQYLLNIAPGTGRAEISRGQHALGLVVMVPFYYVILIFVGTAFGRYAYTMRMVTRPITKIRSML